MGTSPSRRPTVRTAELYQDEEAPIIEITDLVKANPFFHRLARALRLTEEAARKLLRTAMADAGTHAGIITPEDLWFMMPRIEVDVLAYFVDQDASVRRDQMNELLRRAPGTRYAKLA